MARKYGNKRPKVHLEIRPIYHKTDTRIDCHVFICMLSYYLIWHLSFGSSCDLITSTKSAMEKSFHSLPGDYVRNTVKVCSLVARLG